MKAGLVDAVDERPLRMDVEICGVAAVRRDNLMEGGVDLDPIVLVVASRGLVLLDDGRGAAHRADAKTSLTLSQSSLGWSRALDVSLPYERLGPVTVAVSVPIHTDPEKYHSYEPRGRESR